MGATVRLDDRFLTEIKEYAAEAARTFSSDLEGTLRSLTSIFLSAGLAGLGISGVGQ